MIAAQKMASALSGQRAPNRDECETNGRKNSPFCPPTHEERRLVVKRRDTQGHFSALESGASGAASPADIGQASAVPAQTTPPNENRRHRALSARLLLLIVNSPELAFLKDRRTPASLLFMLSDLL